MIEAHGALPAGQSQRAHDDPGQHRRARQPRIQHRARPAPRRRGEEADAALRRERDADRDGELRQGKARTRVTTKRRGPRIAATKSSIAASNARVARSHGIRRWRVALLLAAQLATAPARAALFDDDEARKRIDALRERVDQLEQSLVAAPRRARGEERGAGRHVRDVEQIKADIAKLRGQYEVLTYELEQAQKRQTRPVPRSRQPRCARSKAGPRAAGDARCDRRRSGRAGRGRVAGAAAAGRASRRRRIRAARLRRRARAVQERQLRRRDRQLPDFRQDVSEESARAVRAVLGGQRAVRASAIFAARSRRSASCLPTYPDSQKIPDAMLNIASCQIELGDAAGARRTLEDIVAKYPTSEAAGKARQRLPAAERHAPASRRCELVRRAPDRLAAHARAPRSAVAEHARRRTASGCPRSCCSRRRWRR